MEVESTLPGGIAGVFSGSIEQCLKVEGRSDINVLAFDNLPSTNTYLSELARKSVETKASGQTPILCAADWQTSGSGRRGKVWASERGNITFSLLSEIKRPASELLGLSLVTGVCAAQVLAEDTAQDAAVDIRLKWPNDLIVNDAKLGGLLIELQSADQVSATRVITGIGINYRSGEAVDGKGIHTTNLADLVSEPPSRTRLIARIAANVLAGYSRFEADGWAPFAESWDTFDYLKGKLVTILEKDSSERVKALGVDANGALLVERNGQAEPVYSGEVSVRRAE